MTQDVATSLHRVKDHVAGFFSFAVPGRATLLDQRPMLLDARRALLNLPATLQIDRVPSFWDGVGKWLGSDPAGKVLGRGQPGD